MREGATLLGLLLTLGAFGCAVAPTPDVTAFAAQSGSNSFELFDRGVNSSALVLPVVHDRQREGPSCGAHALASVVNYWTPGSVSGDALYHDTPPTSSANGYSMAELMSLARAHGLVASAVRLSDADVVRELEAGRPVLVPVRLPSIYVQQYTLPGANVPVVGFARNALITRAGRTSELLHAAVVNHYLLVVGYQEDMFVVVEPVMGYRTIRFAKLERYRRAFGDAALVFSAAAPPAPGRTSQN